MKASTWVLGLAPSAAVVLAFTLAWDRMPTPEAKGAATFWDDGVVDFVRERVARSYVDELPTEKTAEMFYAALDAYVGVLDAYSNFLAPDEYRKWVEHHSGHYAGIGVKVAGDALGLRILGVLPGGPADRAGVRIGDVVTEVEGKSLAAADPSRDETVRVLKGRKGSEVSITVLSKPAEGEEAASRRLVIVRDDIQQPTVLARRIGADGRYSHIRITEFVDTTDDEFDRQLDGALAEGARGVVLDLRGNGGGVLDATVRVADRFLRSGDIVRTVGRRRGGQVHVARDEGTIPESIGLVVLVDAQSASASEALAGALQDHRRGVLLGTRTHGKFLVQSIVEVPDKEAAVKLTTARYTTPLGRWFKRRARSAEGVDRGPPEGLLPDVVVELDAENQVRLAKAAENAEAAIWGQPPDYPEVASTWVDPQLARAVELLEGTLVLQDVKAKRKTSSQG